MHPSNVSCQLQACKHWASSAATTGVLGSVSLYFTHFVGSPTVRQRPNAQAVANVVWALGTLKYTPPHDSMLDQL